MSKVSMPALHARALPVAMLLVALAVLVTGCGGGSSAASPPVNNNPPPVVPPTPPPVEGVATPTSVAVVTATNAQ